MPDLTFRVHAASESPARVRVNARSFTFLVDEPPELGGEDRGPNPVETLLGALAGCLNVVAHLVAKEHGIAISNLQIEISGPLNPAQLFRQPTSDPAGFKRIDVVLRFSSSAPREALDAWLREVESRCPVSDNLSRATPLYLSWVNVS